MKLSLVIPTILITLIVLVGMRPQPPQRPYTLMVEEVTEDLLTACRRDPNCMDVLAFAERDGEREFVYDEGCDSDLDCCTQFGDCDKNIY